ncbi:hypothetical protein LVJ82_07770 [Vitreoscilla massiliensis]|uniref:Transmembrane protein n=1 Tax=Vitreoscilla massiliensis TaxID=1689272 RepID=A0ABY4E522_9NEIS|nr:hypothetical protein [Vitreoscilla massiliensis]UOO90847.1 hypothetical protein LVJ82_07770 [Vitreoscilla massiliensis]
MQDQQPLTLDANLVNQWLFYIPMVTNALLILLLLQEPGFHSLHVPVWVGALCLLVYVSKSQLKFSSLRPSFKQQKFKQVFSRLCLFFVFGPLCCAINLFLSLMPADYQCGPYCFNSQAMFTLFTSLALQVGIYFMSVALLADKFTENPPRPV